MEGGGDDDAGGCFGKGGRVGKDGGGWVGGGFLGGTDGMGLVGELMKRVEDSLAERVWG